MPASASTDTRCAASSSSSCPTRSAPESRSSPRPPTGVTTAGVSVAMASSSFVLIPVPMVNGPAQTALRASHAAHVVDGSDHLDAVERLEIEHLGSRVAADDRQVRARALRAHAREDVAREPLRRTRRWARSSSRRGR